MRAASRQVVPNVSVAVPSLKQVRRQAGDTDVDPFASFTPPASTAMLTVAFGIFP